MHTLDRYIAQTQRWITVFYALLFAGSLSLLIALPKPIDEVIKTILIGSSSTLGAVLMMQNTFWFGRPRGGGVPDPSTTTSVVTDPSGASTSTKIETSHAVTESKP